MLRALKGLERGYTLVMKLDKKTLITFEDIKRLNEAFPALFLPMFLLQDSMREKTMGTDWFFEKLTKYKAVRRKMAADGANVEELVEIELQRFHADEEREMRMKTRAEAIRQETSELKKTILLAHQFVDEFS
jgi:hypothetical protein